MDPYYSRHEVSNSDLSSLFKYLYGYDDTVPVEAYRFGNLIDYMITEPHRVDAYKLQAGDYSYSREEFRRAEQMRRSFLQDSFCREIIRGADTQKTMINPSFEIEFEGINFTLPVRCKWDIWRGDLGWGGDIKSTTAETQQQFEAACRHFDYDRQRAWYMDIAGSDQDILIGISKKNFKIFKLPIRRGDEFYQSGREKYGFLAFKWWVLFGDIKHAA